MDSGSLYHKNVFGVRWCILQGQKAQEFLHRTHELVAHVIGGPRWGQFRALVRDELLVQWPLTVTWGGEKIHL